MKTNRGFTLLEILVALSVFAILATITSSAIYHAFKTRDIVTQQSNQLSRLQLAMALIQRDTQQIIDRPIRGSQRRLLPALIGKSEYLEFTRGGNVNADAHMLRSNLVRVAFLCNHHQLIRRHWEALDTPNRNAYQDTVLLNHLTQCQFAYLTHSHQLLSEWTEKVLAPNQRKESLPTAIQLTITIQKLGNASLLFVIPEALYANN